MSALRARLPNLPDGRSHPVRWLLLALALFLLQQIAVEALALEGVEALIRRCIFLGSTIILAGMALLFRHYIGAWLISAGIVMNLIPMIAHGGLMPIAIETITASGYFPSITEADIGQQINNSKDIVLFASDIRFEFLADRYPVTVPGYGPNIYSLGDFVLFAGVALAAVEALISVLRPGWRAGSAFWHAAARGRAALHRVA